MKFALFYTKQIIKVIFLLGISLFLIGYTILGTQPIQISAMAVFLNIYVLYRCYIESSWIDMVIDSKPLRNTPRQKLPETKTQETTLTLIKSE